MSKISLLEINKTVTFPSPFSDDSITLIRNGVVPENSFFHSVLTSYSKDYFYMDSKNKIKYFEKFKSVIFNNKSFEQNNDYFLIFKNTLNDVLQHLYDIVNNINNDCKDKNLEDIVKTVKNNNVTELLFDLISLKDFKDLFNLNIDKKYIYDEYKIQVDNKLKNILDSVEILKEVENVKHDYIVKNVINIKDTLIEKVKKLTYNMYYKKITKNINVELVNLISKKLNINIYFIDSNTRLPFLLDPKQNFKDRKSIIVLKIDNRYETIGFLLPHDKIQRLFDYNENIIKKINMFLFDKNKLLKNYPDLIVYIQKDIYDSDNENNSVDDSNNNSDIDKKSDDEDSDDDN